MPQVFRLYWLRETGCDAGTPLRADELDPIIRNPVAALAGDSEEVIVRLPYLDRRDWRRRGEILSTLAWERQAAVIFPRLSPGHQLRTVAANLALSDSAWNRQPAPSDPLHMALWRDVSIALQGSFRQWIPEQYFRETSRLEDREVAYPVIAYEAARIFHGHLKGLYTYDFHDYPECRLTLTLATKMTGRAIQHTLSGYEQRLHSAGLPKLARRYAPIWYQDVLVATRKKPKAFITLLAAESAFIEALVELGSNRTHEGVHHFSKIAGQALRSVLGMDLRHLGARALMEATRVLENSSIADSTHGRADCREDLLDCRML